MSYESTRAVPSTPLEPSRTLAEIVFEVGRDVYWGDDDRGIAGEYICNALGIHPDSTLSVAEQLDVANARGFKEGHKAALAPNPSVASSTPTPPPDPTMSPEGTVGHAIAHAVALWKMTLPVHLSWNQMMSNAICTELGIDPAASVPGLQRALAQAAKAVELIDVDRYPEGRPHFATVLMELSRLVSNDDILDGRAAGSVPGDADREPQPSDGPDYHQDHAAWKERQ